MESKKVLDHIETIQRDIERLKRQVSKLKVVIGARRVQEARGEPYKGK